MTLGIAKRRKMINVGLMARFFMPRPLQKPCTNVVLPEPKSPESAITEAPLRLKIGNWKLEICLASFSPSCLVLAEENVFKIGICFYNIEHERCYDERRR